MYNKLFTKILDSSIWLEDDATRIVWLTCIAAMDQDGFVQFASVANLARRANVALAATEDAVKKLEAPDRDSSDPDHEGRRIERVQGGWMVLNAEKYRALVTRAVSREQTRVRVQRFRAKGNDEKRISNASVTPSEATTETDATATAGAHTISPNAARRSDGFEDFWASYPKKVGKAAALKIWQRLKPSAETQQRMSQTLEWQRPSEQWTKDGGQFVPNPATWLSQGRWQDERPQIAAIVSDVGRQTAANGLIALRLLEERDRAREEATRAARG